MTIPLGGDRGELVLQYLGRGHTEGDIVAWLPQHRIMFAGDLVEAKAALYTGDAFHQEWSSTTLDAVKAMGADQLVGGRGEIPKGKEAVDAAIEQSRGFLTAIIDNVRATQAAGGSLKDAFEACHVALSPTYGHWPIFEHTLPFDVARTWEELQGVERPTIWTAERDREIWAQLQG
jgi:glyoxylase-like metal-dependent hydrolase (beta-lactamase superfamily II)